MIRPRFRPNAATLDERVLPSFAWGGEYLFNDYPLPEGRNRRDSNRERNRMVVSFAMRSAVG